MSKGNINRSNSVLAATDKIYVHILCSKCSKTPEMFSIKRVLLVILSRKEISIVAIVRLQQQTRYMCLVNSQLRHLFAFISRSFTSYGK